MSNIKKYNIATIEDESVWKRVRIPPDIVDNIGPEYRSPTNTTITRVLVSDNPSRLVSGLKDSIVKHSDPYKLATVVVYSLNSNNFRILFLAGDDDSDTTESMCMKMATDARVAYFALSSHLNVHMNIVKKSQLPITAHSIIDNNHYTESRGWKMTDIINLNSIHGIQHIQTDTQKHSNISQFIC